MSSTFTLEKLHRGPMLKLIFSLATFGHTTNAICIEPINVHNKALVVLNFHSSKPNTSLRLTVKMKKNENSTQFIVPLNISFNNYNRLYFCSDDWTETQINEDIRYSNKTESNGHGYSIILYTLHINITVSEPIPNRVNNRLYADTEFTDFQLHTTDGTVAVHKAMLFIHSDMFKTMLSGEWKETTEGRINIDGVTMETLQHLKDYMYLGTLPDEGLEQLLVIAARYLMDSLKTDCITKLVKTMKPENFDGLVELACQNNMPELIKALFLQIPDDIVNGIHELKINKE